MNLKIFLTVLMAFASLAAVQAFDAQNPEPVTEEDLEQDYQEYLDSIDYEAGFVVPPSTCARDCYFHPRRQRCMHTQGGRCMA